MFSLLLRSLGSYFLAEAGPYKIKLQYGRGKACMYFSDFFGKVGPNLKCRKS